jgi:membrane-associated phospholipid phosphatase
MKKFKITLLSLIFATNSAFGITVRKAGDYAQISVPLIALASTVFHQDTMGAKQLALSLYTTQVTVFSLKHIFPVARQLNPNNTQSFISGHTAIPMASSAYLLQRYDWQLALPAYMLTAFVAYSRVSSKAHRLNEVIGGAVLGQFVSYLVTTSFHDDNVQVVAGINSIALNVNF